MGERVLPELFKNMLKGEESLLLNPIALDPEFQPKLIPYRDNMQHYMASCIKPLFQQRTGKNLLLIGPPGVGKTVCARHVLNELGETTDDVITVYINCWKKDTTYRIVLDICEQVGYTQFFNKKADELLKIASGLLNKKSVVFVFDEVDKLAEHQVLYYLSEEIYRKAMFLVTNDIDWLKNLDNRLKSRLMAEIMEFKPYNYEQTLGILKQRTEYAFVKNVWNDEALKAIAEKTFELGDIRAGLFLLKEAGATAEEEGSKKIAVKHANAAITKLKDFSGPKDVEIDDEGKKILELIKGNSGSSSKQIFEIFSKDSTKSYRTFSRKVKDLEEAGKIEVESSGNAFILRFKEDSG